MPNSYKNSYWNYNNGYDENGRFTTSFGNRGVVIDSNTFKQLQVNAVSDRLVANGQEVMNNFSGNKP